MGQPITTQPALANQVTGTSSESEELEITSFIDPDDVLNEFVNQEEFSKAVMYHVQFYKVPVIEAVMIIAGRIGLEPQHDTDQIKLLIDDNLRQQLFIESINRNTIRGELPSTLDV